MIAPELSVIFSINNRVGLLRRGLWSLEKQRLASSRFEVVVVDDGSTDGLAEELRTWRGRLRIVRVTYDRTRHPIYRELNADRPPDTPPRFWHTPAYAHNIGFRVARGRMILLTQPEIIHDEENIGRALSAPENALTFGDCWMADAWFSRRLEDEWSKWGKLLPSAMRGIVGADSSVHPGSLGHWYLLAMGRGVPPLVAGVDEEYMRGAYGEDDDFRERCRAAGVPIRHDPGMIGIHQHHADTDPHRDRASDHWEEGACRNRFRLAGLLGRIKDMGCVSNAGRRWGDESYVVSTETLE